ncbi:GFA family protein, partial [Thioclava sp. BHET1]
YQSSSWAMRAWCRECGSGLYYRVTEAGPYAEDYEIPLGLFDDPNGLRMEREIYVDHRPDSYAFVDEDGRVKLTRQDCIERYSRLDGE